jgi:hypothetical protein
MGGVYEREGQKDHRNGKKVKLDGPGSDEITLTFHEVIR